MGHIIGSSRKKLVILFGLLLATHSSIAQTGYNYPRPEVPLGASGSAIATRTGSLVGFPTTASGSSPGYAGAGSPTSPSFGYTNPQITGSAFGSTSTGFSGGKRPISSRTDIFGPVGIAAQLPQPDIAPISVPQVSVPQVSVSQIPIPQLTLQQQTQPQSQPQPMRQPQPRPQAQPQPQTQPQQQPQPQPQTQPNPQENDDYLSTIPGRPVDDYPIYNEVPETSFDCNEYGYYGYFADVEARCQVFHVCANNRTYSFLCANGTIFSQEHLVCVWYNMFDCIKAPEMYANNKQIFDYSKPTETQPTPGAYPTPIARPQPSFQNTFRPTGTGSGVYSTSVRPTMPSGSYSGVSTGVSQIGTTAFPSSATGSGRFTSPSSVATGGAFPTGPPTAAAGYGTTRRAGFSPIQEATFPSSQISPTTANREYLPPRRS